MVTDLQIITNISFFSSCLIILTAVSTAYEQNSLLPNAELSALHRKNTNPTTQIYNISQKSKPISLFYETPAYICWDKL